MTDSTHDDLVKRLKIMARDIEMWEKLAWGSDSALMREAAKRIEELEGKLAAGILVEYDDGSRIFLSSYAGGAATGGAWSELTLLEEAQDGTMRLRRYTADGDWSAAATLAELKGQNDE